MRYYEFDRYVAVPVEEPAEPTKPEARLIAIAAAPTNQSRPSCRGGLTVGVFTLIASASLAYLLYATSL